MDGMRKQPPPGVQSAPDLTDAQAISNFGCASSSIWDQRSSWKFENKSDCH